MAEQRDEEYPASYWKDRADEAQAKLDQMVTEDGRRWMREIARLYDKLAVAAAKREAEKKTRDECSGQDRRPPPS